MWSKIYQNQNFHVELTSRIDHTEFWKNIQNLNAASDPDVGNLQMHPDFWCWSILLAQRTVFLDVPDVWKFQMQILNFYVEIFCLHKEQLFGRSWCLKVPDANPSFLCWNILLARRTNSKSEWRRSINANPENPCWHPDVLWFITYCYICNWFNLGAQIGYNSFNWIVVQIGYNSFIWFVSLVGCLIWIQLN
jgi:hypothetical protein